MQLFSLYHCFWLALTAIFVTGCYRMGRIDSISRWHRIFRGGVFVAICANEAARVFYRHQVLQIPLVDNLPLHLCDLSVIIMLYTLATNRSWTGELSYYMGAVGALLAVCMPAISETGNIRLLAEIRYFLTHIWLVGVGVYFTFGSRYYPGRGAVWRSYGFVHLYALLITPLNLMMETNYFFTISAPQQLAFIHRYPHWLFLVVASLIFLAVFNLLYLPFAVRARRQANTRAPAG